MIKKQKIQTITCHNVYNHGAILQEFALLYYLKKMGYDAQTINYKPPYLSGHFNLSVVSNPKFDVFPIKYIYLLLKLPKRLINLKRKKRFDKFEKDYINCTSKIFHSNEEIKKDIPKADIYICGSDQIWNTVYSNGKDPAFYLNFVPSNKKKISYAASIATDNIPLELQNFIKKSVKQINMISVRETSAVSILNQLGIENVTQVLDPVFLLNKDEWNTISDKNIKLNKPYILIYDADNNTSIRLLAQQMSKKNNWKIYSISQNIKYADKSFYLYGPKTFLTLIKSAEFIISNSFHAVAFSLIFQKQFAVFERKENINTRMNDIVKLLDIQNVIYSYDAKLKNLSYDIDYNIVTPIIKKNIQKSKFFLHNAIKKES